MAKRNTRIGGAVAAIAAAAIVATAPPAAAQSADMGSGGSNDGSSWDGGSTGGSFCGTTPVFPILSWGWLPLDGRAPKFVPNPDTPGGTGSGALDFGVASTSETVSYYHPTRTALVQAGGLAFSAYLEEGNVAPSYQLKVLGAERTDTGDGAAVGFTSLVWEPHYNGGNPPADTWQTFTALEEGQWWSTRDIAGATGRQRVSLEAIKAANPNARITSYGLQVGSGASASTQFADNVTFGCTNWDFEVLPSLSSGSASSGS
ncbi:hypothetical protein [Rhodococcus kronopolitis]|uniref:Uncharacterized protein n=1 Tax=Rhodococcus kronopolitis TaxID=1460226 RepID=A0ABV9FWY6_9NOCA